MLFYWPNIKKDVLKWVAKCDICQRVKSENIYSPGLLQPLPIPEQPWRDIGMDFIEELPISHHKNAILVVIDRLTKFGHFIPLEHPSSAQEITEVLLKKVYRLHGLPQSIVTERRSIFTSNFW